MFGFGAIERSHAINHGLDVESKLRVAQHNLAVTEDEAEALKAGYLAARAGEIALELRMAGAVAIIDLLEGAVAQGRRLPREAGRETSSVAGSPERRAIYVVAVRKRAQEMVAAEKSAEWRKLIVQTAEDMLVHRGAIAKAGGPAI